MNSPLDKVLNYLILNFLITIIVGSLYTKVVSQLKIYEIVTDILLYACKSICVVFNDF